MYPYLALQQLLAKVESDVSAATIHGLWCGRLAAGDEFATADWWQLTVQVMGHEGPIEANMTAAFKAVASFANQHLQQESFGFEPWLPADDAQCSQRIEALAEWCQGFIEGLTSVLGNQLASASEDVREILKDLLDIGEVDTGVSGSEDDEKNFGQLTEYVKVAALNVWHDFAGQEAPKKLPGIKPPTIH